MTIPNILLVTKGHPFERDAFFSMFDDMNVNWTHVEQPAAQEFFNTKLAANYDALVMYDMPGIQFGEDGPLMETPSDSYKKGFIDLLESGKGMVFMHHAIAGWPSWQEYAEIIGGRFLYLPATIRGESRPDSGYRHKVEHTLTVLENHPITAGLPAEFQMTDELYLSEVFTDSIEPLLTSSYDFTRDHFYSASKAVKDGMMYSNEGWEHPDGSNIVGWVKHYRNSPIAYMQGGDDPEAYTSTHYRQLIESAIQWAASDAALQWARLR